MDSTYILWQQNAKKEDDNPTNTDVIELSSLYINCDILFFGDGIFETHIYPDNTDILYYF